MDNDLPDILKESAQAEKKSDEEKRREKGLQITLGELIEKLEQVEDKDSKVLFDFGYFRPTKLHSYRGYYRDLAIGFDMESKAPTVETFIEMLKEAIDEEFTGYKGGKFEMDRSVCLWAAKWGNETSVTISGVREGFRVILETRKVRRGEGYGEPL